MNPLRELMSVEHVTAKQLAEMAQLNPATVALLSRPKPKQRAAMSTRRAILKALDLPHSMHREIFGPLPGEKCN